MSKSSRPVVIKKVQKGGHGAHGSWKIAYADFMTAMMAFFMVMWLLSGVSKTQLEGITQYFRHPMAMSMASGDKTTASDSAIPGGGDDPRHSKGEEHRTAAEMVFSTTASTSRLRAVRDQLKSLVRQNPTLAALGAQLKVDMTDEGLRIQILDDSQQSMFRIGSADVVPRLAAVLDALAPFLNKAPYGITISGHTDDTPYVTGLKGYSNWELSSDRANAARRELFKAGLSAAELIRVMGHADTMNLSTKANDPMNRRISIVLLSESARRTIDSENQVVGETGGTSAVSVLNAERHSSDVTTVTPHNSAAGSAVGNGMTGAGAAKRAAAAKSTVDKSTVENGPVAKSTVESGAIENAHVEKSATHGVAAATAAVGVAITSTTSSFPTSR